MSFSIRQESPKDHPIIEALADDLFGPGRFAKASYRYRDHADPILSLSKVALHDNKIIGSVRIYPFAHSFNILLLGPLIVNRDYKNQGTGKALMTTVISYIKHHAPHYNKILLVGDLDYFKEFGFSRHAASNCDFLPPVNRLRLLGLDL